MTVSFVDDLKEYSIKTWQEILDHRFIKDFLARNGIPYQWLDAESDKEAHYFIFFTHISQYFSIREAPST